MLEFYDDISLSLDVIFYQGSCRGACTMVLQPDFNKGYCRIRYEKIKIKLFTRQEIVF